jgi:tRNA A37 threonylcarbamoyladenosine biosynthesis protein TsaE
MKLLDTNLKMCDVGTNAFCIETDADQIKLATIVLAVAKKGYGKSYFLSNLLKWLKFDRIIVISPTFESKESQFKHLSINTEDVFDPDDPDVIKKQLI